MIKKKGLVIFSPHAVKPDIIGYIDTSKGRKEDTEDENAFSYPERWFISPLNPEGIVRSYSHLKIKKGYKLRGYQFISGPGGNGIVWSIPADKELPPPEECDSLDDAFSSPRPSFAVDPMLAIDGDKTANSYLQAAIVYHELGEFGAYWHGAWWSHHTILPSEQSAKDEKGLEWEMCEEEPDIWEPHFYLDESECPTIVFYTYSLLYPSAIYRFTHTFTHDDYAIKMQMDIVANGNGGIIP